MKKIKLVFSFVIGIILVSGIAAACAQTDDIPDSVIDDLGRSVQISRVPERIISLAPSNTELLFTLGLGDNVVGVTKYCEYPEEALGIEKIGGYGDVDIEKVVSLKPDLVIAEGIQHESEVIPALENIGIPVIALMATTLGETIADINLLGKVTGKKKQASDLIDSLDTRINNITVKTEGLNQSAMKRVLFVVWHDPIWTSGEGTLAHDLVLKAGGYNIATGLSGHQSIPLEKVVEQDPEVIIVIEGHGDAEGMLLEWAMNEERLKNVSARMTSPPDVYQIDADITTLPTPRAVDGLEALAKLIHPELF